MALSIAPRRESEIQRAILTYLRTVPGVVAWRQNVGTASGEHKARRWFVRYGFPGLSDILGWVDFCRFPGPERGQARAISCAGKGMYHVPRFLAIEVKRPGGEPTAQQATFLACVREAGGLAFVATSVEDVVRELERSRGR